MNETAERNTCRHQSGVRRIPEDFFNLDELGVRGEEGQRVRSLQPSRVMWGEGWVRGPHGGWNSARDALEHKTGSGLVPWQDPGSG